MAYLWIALIGLAVGAIAKIVLPGSGPRGKNRPDPGAIIVTMIVGMLGGVFGGVVAHGMDICTYSEPAWFIAGIAGASILILLYNRVLGKRKLS